jgi:fructose-1,6-bisphosphatase/inositol monophosphatase family enzyme
MPSSRRGALAGVVHEWIDRMIMRNAGSSALHLAYLARGAMDAVYCDDCRLWDIAAGVLLVEEAGGKLISCEGSEYFPLEVGQYAGGQMPFLAAGPRTLESLMEEYTRAKAAERKAHA